MANKSDTIISILSKCSDRLESKPPKGRRYTTAEMDYFTYKYIQGGRAMYEFEQANSVAPDIRTCQRYLHKLTFGVEPDRLRMDDFAKFLQINNFPKAFVLSEDATRITGGIGYDITKNTVYGLVPPLNQYGMPIENFFTATSPKKVMEYLEKYSIGRNLYVVMAQPLSSDSRPFCLMYTCSDNKFKTEDVLRRWAFTEKECEKVEITLACRASDGDARLVQSMLQKMDIPNTDSNPFGAWYACKYTTNNICIQDPTHLINKLRMRIMRVDKQLIIGSYVVSRAHLVQLLALPRDQHGLTPSDLDTSDKMKFKPVQKITQPRVINLLRTTIPESLATAIYLELMNNIMQSFMNDDMATEDRVFNVWCGLFFMRAWRRSCVSKHKHIQHCITTNAYWGLEINAHALINSIILCREKGYDLDITLWQSQACESFFRSARSFSSTESTVVNFDMKTFESRLNRIEAKTDIMYKQKDNFTFPRLKNQEKSSKHSQLPTNIQISNVVQKAEIEAKRLLKSLGVKLSVDSFKECIYIRKPKTKPDPQTGNFEFVPVPDEPCEVIRDSDEDLVYDCEELLTGTDVQLHVKDASGFNKRNTFKIRNKNGKIVHVKKSTFIWMLQSETERVSPDRLQRFKELHKNENFVAIFQNIPLQDIRIGEWVLISYTSKLLVCNVYGFIYLSGKRTSYSRTSAPIRCPEEAFARGLGTKGSFFELSFIDGDYILELLDNSEKICIQIENYKSHLTRPEVSAGLLLYGKDSAAYIKAYMDGPVPIF
nr:uncharacterized protein LOC115255635 [Aedes albopictus]